MFDWFSVVILSVVEGITEFLPVSSTGHMIIVSHVLSIPKTPLFEAFLVMVQCGAILAVVTAFWHKFLFWYHSWIIGIYSTFFFNLKKNFNYYKIDKTNNSHPKLSDSTTNHNKFLSNYLILDKNNVSSCPTGLNSYENTLNLIDIELFLPTHQMFQSFFSRSIKFLKLKDEIQCAFKKFSFFSYSIYLNSAQIESILVALATIPTFLLGFLLKSWVHQLFSTVVVAWALIVGGLAIIVVERILSSQASNVKQLTFKTSLCIGFGQCFALWPGFSRSAATILTARVLGFSRVSAAEVSFLIGFPTLLGASTYELIKSYTYLSADFALQLVVGILISWATAHVCVVGFLSFLKTYSMTWFAYYRILLGVLLLLWTRQ